MSSTSLESAGLKLYASFCFVLIDQVKPDICRFKNHVYSCVKACQKEWERRYIYSGEREAGETGEREAGEREAGERSEREAGERA